MCSWLLKTLASILDNFSSDVVDNFWSGNYAFAKHVVMVHMVIFRKNTFQSVISNTCRSLKLSSGGLLNLRLNFETMWK